MQLSAGTAARALLEFLFPSRCVHCRTEGALLCTRCLDGAPRLNGPVCRRCALPLQGGNLCSRCASRAPALDRLIAVFQMGGAIRDAVLGLKYNDLRAVAPVLAEQMASHPSAGRLTLDAVLPVPLHPSRLRSRGYNQSELLARGVARQLDRPLDARSLRRRVNTPPLAKGVSEPERHAAMRGAFAVSGEMTGRRVLIVDDVATTCATLNACAAALKQAGAAYVAALVLAREI